MTLLPSADAGIDFPFAALSRELSLLCAPDGTIRWADDRARQLVGDVTGRRLHDLASPGSAGKVQRLLAAAAAGPVERHELLLEVGGAPSPLVVVAMPHHDGVALTGTLVARDFGTLLDQMADSMSELAALHRETEQQRREIAEGRREQERLTVALDESGRGLRVLYDELDAQSESLRSAAASRSRFVASASHELRTPINSILGLSRLLLAHVDGPLHPEQEKQIGFIHESAETLSELVNDLLDLAKVDAGRTRARPETFEVAAMFGTLRGMLRPLATNPDVRLAFEVDDDVPALESDEGKIAQVLRNLVSNALKFTPHGEVRVRARPGADDTVVFEVRDTGIGIAPEDQERVFEEFIQLDTPLHRMVKGTGLGLTVCRGLAGVLAGRITLESAPGRGSTFALHVPRVHPEAVEFAEMRERNRVLDPNRAPVLVVEDDRQTLFMYERFLVGSGFQVIPARSIAEARELLGRFRPSAVVLDVVLEGETTWSFLAELKQDPATSDVPTLVVTVVDREQKARALGADEFCVKPLDAGWFLRKLRAMAAHRPVESVLIIDDDDVARYLVRRMLADTPYALFEAADGPTGVQLARDRQPDLILLDFVLADITAFEVLDDLKADPRTRHIPVIINTAKDLEEEERRRLAADTAAILSKHSLSREVAIGRIRDALTSAVTRAGVPEPMT